MRPDVGSAVTLLMGVVTLRLALSSLMLNYVKLSMRPWLVVSGIVLCTLGVIGFLRATRAGAIADHDHGDDCGHEHGPSRAAWMLLLPVLAIFLITPDALGSFAANRQAGTVTQTSADFGDLPPARDGAIELSLREFTDRAVFDEERSLDGERVRLIGFVTAADPGSGADFVLNRFLISCCAADARVLQVEIMGVPAPPVDSWVTITGEWDGSEAESLLDIPALQADEVVPMAAPEVPYETL